MRAIFNAALDHLLSDRRHWQTLQTDVYVPLFPVASTQSVHCLAAYRLAGAFIALYTLALEQVPPTLSLVMVFCLMHPGTLFPPLEFIRQFNSALVDRLQPWLDLSPEAAIPDDVFLTALTVECFGREVSMHCVAAHISLLTNHQPEALHHSAQDHHEQTIVILGHVFMGKTGFHDVAAWSAMQDGFDLAGVITKVCTVHLLLMDS
jgi:hypothetical protein